MQWFLLLIILGMAGGGYYEYTQLEQAQQAVQTKFDAEQKKNDDLQVANKKLQDDKDAITKTESDDQAKITDLNTQLQTAQTTLASTQADLAAAKKTIAEAAAKAAAAAAAAHPVAPTNSLGDFNSLDGKNFQNTQLLKVDADGITFSHSQGITKVNFSLLPPDLQKRFGYDPRKAATLTAAQVQAAEQQRQAQMQASGN